MSALGTIPDHLSKPQRTVNCKDREVILDPVGKPSIFRRENHTRHRRWSFDRAAIEGGYGSRPAPWCTHEVPQWRVAVRRRSQTSRGTWHSNDLIHGSTISLLSPWPCSALKLPMSLAAPMSPKNSREYFLKFWTAGWTIEAAVCSPICS